MNITPHSLVRLPAFLAILFTGGCTSFTSADASASNSAPSSAEIREMSFSGIHQFPGPVKLSAGTFEGKPDSSGAASRPRLDLIPDFRLLQDFNADGREEAAVLLSASSGGTGVDLYLAIAGWKNGQPANLATALVGDRVQVRKARIDPNGISLDLVQAGPGDAMCCPGSLVTRSWRLTPSGLLELPSTAPPQRLSLQAIQATEWTLTSWSASEPAPAETKLTLRYQDGRLSGSSGCNNFFTAATDGRSAGDLSLSPIGATRKACPAPLSAVESRFLKQLQGVNKFGFFHGRLVLTYEVDGRWGSMLFSDTRNYTRTPRLQ